MTYDTAAEIDAHRVLLVKLTSQIVQMAAKDQGVTRSALLDELLAASDLMVDRNPDHSPEFGEAVKQRLAALLDTVALV